MRLTGNTCLRECARRDCHSDHKHGNPGESAAAGGYDGEEALIQVG
jgi:hypothetical protein